MESRNDGNDTAVHLYEVLFEEGPAICNLRNVFSSDLHRGMVIIASDGRR